MKRHVFYSHTGTEYDAKRGSTRVAWLSILGAMVVLFASYSAYMTSVLSVFKLTMPFEDVPSLYHTTGFTIGSVKGTAYDNYFNVSLLVILKHIRGYCISVGVVL